MSGIPRTLRSLRKFGKLLSFPSAPSTWVCRMVEKIEHLQDRRPKSKILFPFPEDGVSKTKFPSPEDNYDHCATTATDNTTVDVDDEYYTCPATRFSGSLYKESIFWDSDSAVDQFLTSQIPEYSESVDKMVAEYKISSTIEQGKPFDVISLLSYCDSKEKNLLLRGNGDRVDVQELVGKNVVVFCVYVPVFWQSNKALLIRKLPFTCTKFFSGDYEVVVVPKMRDNWATDEDAFDHFLSSFPSSWLAIPFSDALRRDFVCKSLGLISNESICLFVDVNQKVLKHNILSKCYSFRYPPNCKLPWLKTQPRLDAILDCKPSDCLYKISPGSGVVSISELNNKLVGLYVCKDGSFIRTLKLIHQECKSKGLDFEIVLMYMPTFKDCVSPQLFQDAINQVLHKLKIDDWWVLPDDNNHRYYRYEELDWSYSNDEIIIVGPHNEFVEPYGRNVMSCFGFNAYPFSREHVVEKEVEEITGLTLEYLLGNRLLYCDDEKNETANGLLGKTVLLYMDNAYDLDHEIYFPLLDWYFHTKRTQDSSDFEVVFVDIDDYGDGPLHMPWLLCLFDPQHSAFVKNKLLKNRERGLAAFGKDGKILSLNVFPDYLLESCDDPNGIRSIKDLRQEVIDNVNYVYSFNCMEFGD